MPTLCDHRRDFRIPWRSQVGKIWVSLSQEHPDATFLTGFGHFPGKAPCIDRLDLPQLAGFVPDRYRNLVVVRDVLKFLACAVDLEIQAPAFVGVSDDGRLWPSIGPYGCDAHDPVVL